MSLLLKGQDGKPSWTTTLAVPIIIVLTLRYLAGGHSIVVGAVNVNIALMTGMDYLAVITPWLASLGYNGWLEKKPVAPPTAV